MSDIKIITITSLKSYQQYQSRHMPWFKWYADCLQSYDFMSLTCVQKWTFIGLICLANKSDNKIIYDPKYLERVLKIRGIEKNLQPLFNRQMIDFVYTDDSSIRLDKKKKREEVDNVKKIIQDAIAKRD